MNWSRKAKSERSKSPLELCPNFAGVNHLRAIAALEKAGFSVIRQGKHTIMSNGVRVLTIPRHNPINAITMGGIVRDAGLTNDEFRALL